MNRYFRSTDEILAQVTSQLDDAYGYPNAETKTLTALPAPSDCPHGPDGMVYLAIDSEYCDYILPSQMLPQLLDGGLIEEIDEAAYLSILPPV